MSALEDAYRLEAAGTTVRARAVALYLQGRSACEIAAELKRTTTPESITFHLLLAGLEGVHWCGICGRHEHIRPAPRQ